MLHHAHPTPPATQSNIPNPQRSFHRNPPHRASSATHPLVLTFCPTDSVLPTVLHGKRRIFHSKPRPIVILSENSPGEARRAARSEQGRGGGGGAFLEEEGREVSADFSALGTERTIVSIPKVPRQMNIIRAGRSAWLARGGSLSTLITTKRRVSSRAWTRIEGHRLTGYAAAALD